MNEFRGCFVCEVSGVESFELWLENSASGRVHDRRMFWLESRTRGKIRHVQGTSVVDRSALVLSVVALSVPQVF